MSRQHIPPPAAVPEGWTPRQRQVLDLIARGATNAQIGAALGISLDGAKWHVSEILSKLGVESREQAAEYWREHQRPAARLRRGLLDAPWAYVAGAAAAVGLLVAVAGLVWLASRDSGGTPAIPTEGPAGTSSAVVANTPTPQPPAFDCPSSIEPDICQFAVEIEQLLQAGQLHTVIAGSALDTAEGRAKFNAALSAIDPASARLVSIGCPVAAIPLGCGGTFGLGFSSVPQTENPYLSETGIITLAFWRDRNCDFAPLYTTGEAPDCSAPGDGSYPITDASVVTGPGERQQVLAGGGLIQAGTLAGRPTGITDSDVRSEWHPIAPPAQVDQVNGVPVEDWEDGIRGSTALSGVVYIVDGCWGCDGPPAGLDRVYRDADGELVRETLLDGTFMSIHVRTGASANTPLVHEIFVTRCIRGYCGGIGQMTPDAVSELVHSTDGGISWTSLATFPGYAIVQGEHDGVLQIGRDTDGQNYHTIAWPSGDVVSPPGHLIRSSVMTQDGRLAYRDDTLLRYEFEDGTTFWTSPFGLLPAADGVFLSSSNDGRMLIATFRDVEGNPWSAIYLDGDLVRIYRGIQLSASAWFHRDDSALATVELDLSVLGMADLPFGTFQPIPVEVDYATASIAPVETDFFMDTYSGLNRRRVQGYQAGPLLKVTGAGDCLNVRTDPSTSAPVITCYRDGVLVTDGGEEREADGVSWRSIRMGVAPYSGWASSEFLE